MCWQASDAFEDIMVNGKLTAIFPTYDHNIRLTAEVSTVTILALLT